MEGAPSTSQGRTRAQVSPTGPGGSTAGARISPPHPPAPRGLGARTMALARVKPTQGTLPQSRKTPPHRGGGRRGGLFGHTLAWGSVISESPPRIHRGAAPAPGLAGTLPHPPIA